MRLESGFGGGEHLIAEAQAPAPASSGSSRSSTAWPRRWRAIEQHTLGNIRLHRATPPIVLPWLPDMSLARFDLLYPDPWPKRRHWKRRFVQHNTVAAIARMVRPSGEFRFASDIPRLRGVDAAAADAFTGISSGPPSARTTGDSRGPTGPARATRPRPSAKAACPAI